MKPKSFYHIGISNAFLFSTSWKKLVVLQSVFWGPQMRTESCLVAAISIYLCISTVLFFVKMLIYMHRLKRPHTACDVAFLIESTLTLYIEKMHIVCL